MAFSLYGNLAQPLALTAAQQSRAETFFRKGGSIAGTQLDPLYFAPGKGQAEVAVIGRSNSGKSTLLNALLGAYVAPTSKRPGHTAELHFFTFPAAADFYLVDLPGYGYAAHRQEGERAAWMELIAGYLHDRGRDGGGVCRRVLLLLDARRGLTQLDREVVEMMEHFVVPYQAVLTKADTTTPAALRSTAAVVAAELAGGAVAYPTLHAVSAATGAGMRGLQGSLAMAAGLLAGR